ncbi:hypothetical protein UY3_16082 [Chelonia mydas]|uniref:Uncharacterized protein n=1 Tax=Chelonia mydas TaxID=8469 RepID=M7B401_CHEMY|nr:hypothetical protein UY3_16082 [Chelonia mydas]
MCRQLLGAALGQGRQGVCLSPAAPLTGRCPRYNPSLKDIATALGISRELRSRKADNDNPPFAAKASSSMFTDKPL